MEQYAKCNSNDVEIIRRFDSDFEIKYFSCDGRRIKCDNCGFVSLGIQFEKCSICGRTKTTICLSVLDKFEKQDFAKGKTQRKLA